LLFAGGDALDVDIAAVRFHLPLFHRFSQVGVDIGVEFLGFDQGNASVRQCGEVGTAQEIECGLEQRMNP